MKGYNENFRDEALDLLTKLEDYLIDLGREPENAERVDQVFRVMHTIKGSGSMFGYDDVVEFVHDIETVYDLIRQKKIKVDQNLISLTLEARDQMLAMIFPATPAAQLNMERIAGLIMEFRAIASKKGKKSESQPTPESGKPSEIPGPVSTYTIFFRPGLDFFKRGGNPISLIRELKRLGECRVGIDTSRVPPIEALEPEAHYLAWNFWIKTPSDLNSLKDVFIFVEDLAEIRICNEGDPDKPLFSTPTPLDAVPPLVTGHSEKSPSGPPPEKMVADPPPPLEDANPDQPLSSGEPVSEARSAENGAIDFGVTPDKMDRLVNLIGELVSVQARLNQAANARGDSELYAISEELDRLTEQLRESALKIRIIQVGSAMSRFRKFAHDLTLVLGKPVDLEIEGQETELDKTVLEKLIQPIFHLLRNAIEHGIESTAQRIELGKPRIGKIRLTARLGGGNFVFQISDDGQGLNEKKIRAKALSMGLMKKDEPLNPIDLFRLASHPGLTTCDMPDGQFGRGQGLHLAKKAVEDLRGSLEFVAKPGHGTQITLQVPLTLAIIEGLLVKVADRLFVLPLNLVEECIELTNADEIRNHEKNIILVRGQFVSYLKLREKFDIGGQAPSIQQIVVARVHQNRVGFVVDQVVGELQTVIKPLGAFYKKVVGISGATILGDGTVALILDLPKLVRDEMIDQNFLHEG